MQPALSPELLYYTLPCVHGCTGRKSDRKLSSCSSPVLVDLRDLNYCLKFEAFYIKIPFRGSGRYLAGKNNKKPDGQSSGLKTCAKSQMQWQKSVILAQDHRMSSRDRRIIQKPPCQLTYSSQCSSRNKRPCLSKNLLLKVVICLHTGAVAYADMHLHTCIQIK